MVQHLGRDPLDHAPLLLSVDTRLDNKPRPFRFLNVWTTHPGLLEVIKDYWTHPVYGSPLQVLASKLRNVKNALKQWSRTTFGDIFERARSAERVVTEAEIAYDLDPTEQRRSELHHARARLRRALVVKESFWRQNARVKWLSDGDRNTNYFHSLVTERRRKTVLRYFGFSETWIDMIWRLISNVWFSILVNGGLHGFFRSSLGLRQGDPISPSLFVIGIEVLSRALNTLHTQRGFTPFQVPPHCPIITHLAFADDVIIFSSGRTAVVNQILGYNKRVFPIRYLGCPLYTGRSKKVYYTDTYNGVANRILSWKNQILSPGGRVVLIQSVLASMPIHLLATASPPKGMLMVIEKLFAKFLWGSSNSGDKFHWIRWADLCRSKDEGGVGLRGLKQVYDSFSIKLWWKFRQQQSLWAKFMSQKYCAGQHPCLADVGHRGSQAWQRMVTMQRFGEENISWVVWEGALNFWHDNWMGSGALYDKVEVFYDHSVVDFIDRRAWNVDMLHQFLDGELGLPVKVSFFMLRLLQGRLPLMDRLKRFGVCGPSRCLCCQNPQEEDLNHVFCSGEGARLVWHHFESTAGEFSGMHTVRHMVWFCWLRRWTNDRVKFLQNILPSVACWVLWKVRNEGVFEDQKMRIGVMVTRIVQFLHDLLQSQFPGVQCSAPTWEGLLLELGSHQRRMVIRPVYWVTPSGGYKLNSDGCS
ncbi:uncharacterized protein [Coffea arabica]|uniref:Reverse transcriptase domain-containing protein n=1 Tax=Coffea arabica TaxID=13443 RepID=A0ABM4X579_COFAR